MKYGELQDVVGVLNTGATNPDQFEIITKLVLGKIARRRLLSRIKLAEISTGGLSTIDLAAALPDFLALKITNNNNNPFSVYYNEVDNKCYFNMGPSGCNLVGNTLNIPSDTIPDKIYFQYYSLYLVLDVNGVTEKETPTENADTFLIPHVFDDLLVDGILLYISRREKEDNEFTKNVQEWEKRLNEMVFYQ